MNKFLYVMFEDVERIIERPDDACRIVTECLEPSLGDQDDDYLTADAQKTMRARYHLFMYHVLQCELKRDTLNLALAHKAIVEEGQDYITVYEKV